MRILVTGANGFIGKALVDELITGGFAVSGSVRDQGVKMPSGMEIFPSGDLDASTDWSNALNKIECVIHVAGLAHNKLPESSDPKAEFQKVNVDATLNLAKQAIDAGVKRFIYISSIGVNGDMTTTSPFTESDTPNPQSDYAISKLNAEKGLQELLDGSDMELVIVRPPLAYGPGAPGNLERLASLVGRKIPLPFGLCANKRSLVALPNLTNFLALCATHKNAANETFVICDDQELSTKDIISHIGKSHDHAVRFLPIPLGLIRFGLSGIGKGKLYDQLFGSLQIYASKAKAKLGWKPVVTPDQARW